MNLINRTAISNLRQNKGRNILTGIAIFLTTILLLVIPTVGFGIMDLEFVAVNKLYPTYHVMFRNVDERTAENLSVHADIERIGLRQDAAQTSVDNSTLLMIYMNQEAIAMNKVELESGRWPEKSDEIVVSQGSLEALGIKGNIGDTITMPYQAILPGGLDYEKEAEFRICGMAPTVEQDGEKKVYGSYISREFMEQLQPESQREYRVMFRITGADSMTRDRIEETYEKIAENFQVSEGNIVPNSSYLLANYVDPAFYAGIIVVLLVVVFAGVITIYSIYYISLIYKVQEYGKLKALGATKRQIRQIVFREGMLVAGIAIPIGLILGSLCSVIATQYLTTSFAASNSINDTINKILNDQPAMLFNPWIYLVTVVIALATVAISLIRPMRIAAKISPVEAMRYDGSLKTNKKVRKGHRELNLIRLTSANLSRNKKRTAITIITLGMTGILFLVISTVLSCANPKEIARESVFDELVINVKSNDRDKMHPEQAWSEIIKNNPLNESLESKLLEIPGVEKITKSSDMDIEIKDIVSKDGFLSSSIIGIPEEYEGRLNDCIVEGDCTYEDLLSGDKIIMDENAFMYSPETKTVGDKIHILFKKGGEIVEKELEIAAIAKMPQGLGHYFSFVLPESVMDQISDENLNRYWSVAIDHGKLAEAESKIRALLSEEEYLNMHTYEEEVAYRQKNTDFTAQICYVFMAVLGGVGIMNLINTMINSIYVRRRELGIMQAIGLSEKQMVRMLQMEGLFYTVGTLVISLGLGCPMGYAAYLYALDSRMLDIVNYHFPLTQVLVLILVVALLQILLTYLIIKNFRKQSMIDRIRFSE